MQSSKPVLFWASLVAYNLARLLMAQGALLAEQVPRQLFERP
ncbi:hypothetical protein [Thiocapsa sp.]